MTPELREKCLHTIRFLAADAVEKANSGHPGAPMGLADLALVLWTQCLRYQPRDPQWINRDRFVLSAGHASMLQYAMLHLAGYELPIEQLQQFRQWESLTPGHPEFGVTAGVECTTGPLGAGFSNAVGMALGSKMLAARFNTPEFPLVDARVYVIASDGDIQEGISAEAASLAGHWGLNNLIVLYDQNQITIDGHIGLSMSEDVAKRFEAYGWFVQSCDGHHAEQISQCLQAARAQTTKPTLILARTIIGKGAPTKAGTHSSHGAPLGSEEIKRAKEIAGWPLDQTFYIPQEVREVFQARLQDNQKTYAQWQHVYDLWRAANPSLAEVWDTQWSQKVPANLLEQLLPTVEGKEDATRNLGMMIMQAAAQALPQLVGGSADLAGSTMTVIKGAPNVTRASVASHTQPDPSFLGRNINFGIREHAMGGIANGLALFGGWRPYCSTFAVFSDYMRPTVRLAALSKLPTIFVFTHDSFWVGEDGPTHQPIEQAWSLRLIPDVEVWRPADALETAVAWADALERPTGPRPCVMLLTRQKTNALQRPAGFDPRQVARGGYLVQEASGGTPQVILISTGSEGGPTQAVRQALESAGIATRHVSMPCLERFAMQPATYRESLLPASAKIIAIEAGVTAPWYRWADFVIGKDSFGHSAPGAILADKFGLTAPKLIETISIWLKEQGVSGKTNRG